MKPNNTDDLTIAPAIAAEIRAAAAAMHRPAREIVHEALEHYLAERQTRARPVSDANARAAAGARMREQRKGRFLPAGMTIEDVIAWGHEGRA